MSNWLHKIGFTVERGRRILLFLFCLFLAFWVWIVHRLSDNYSAYLSYKVIIHTNMLGRAPDAVSKDALVVRGKSNGFYILRQRFGIDPESVSIDIDSKFLKRKSGTDNGFYLLSSNLKDPISQFFGDNIEIESIVTDTLNFDFAKQTTRSVPIAVNKDLSFDSQYMLVGSVKISPDSIAVYGDISKIDQIDSVKTARLRFSDLEESKQGVITLEKIEGVRFSQNEIYYNIEVSRYVENTGSVALKVINVPQDKLLSMFPYRVSVRYREPLHSKERINLDDQAIVVDYRDLIKSLNNSVRPKWIGTPEQLLYYEIDPPFVECFVVNKRY